MTRQKNWLICSIGAQSIWLMMGSYTWLPKGSPKGSPEVPQKSTKVPQRSPKGLCRFPKDHLILAKRPSKVPLIWNPKYEINQDDASSRSTLITNCHNTAWLKTAIKSSIARMIDSILSICSAAKLLLQVYIKSGCIFSTPMNAWF